jgi:hypothetical protein
MDFIVTLQSMNWEAIIAIVLQVVGAFSLIATQTSNTADNVISDFLLKVVNGLGGNWGKAKNN